MKDELYHYGVPGMKWGKRKAIPMSSGNIMSRIKKQDSKLDASKSGLKSSKKAYEKAYDDYFEGRVASGSTVDKTRSNLKDAKTKYKADQKTAKQLKKDFIKARSKEIAKGQNIVSRIISGITNSNKYQAELEYNLRKYED